MQGVLVTTAAGPYLLAADCVNLYENLDGTGVLPYTVSSIHTDLKAYCVSMEEIQRMVREDSVAVIPGHDELVLRYSEYP